MHRFILYRYTRNGGMHFFRLGRLQLSWCVCRASLPSQNVRQPFPGAMHTAALAHELVDV